MVEFNKICYHVSWLQAQCVVHLQAKIKKSSKCHGWYQKSTCFSLQCLSSCLPCPLIYKTPFKQQIAVSNNQLLVNKIVPCAHPDLSKILLRIQFSLHARPRKYCRNSTSRCSGSRASAYLCWVHLGSARALDNTRLWRKQFMSFRANKLRTKVAALNLLDVARLWAGCILFTVSGSKSRVHFPPELYRDRHGHIYPGILGHARYPTICKLS